MAHSLGPVHNSGLLTTCRRPLVAELASDRSDEQSCVLRLLTPGQVLAFELFDDIGSQAGQHPQYVTRA